MISVSLNSIIFTFLNFNNISVGENLSLISALKGTDRIEKEKKEVLKLQAFEPLRQQFNANLYYARILR